MITIVDEETGEVVVREAGQETRYPLDSAEGFAAVSRAWLRAGWDAKYVYSFTWLGLPVIQLPDDLIRIQEVIFSVKPDVLIETGVAHGGSLVFYASLFKAMGRGRVIGIDIDIWPDHRAAIEKHPLFPLITLIEGSSIDPVIVDRARGLIRPGESVIVLLDSNHSFEHVKAELDLYSPLVSVDSYIVATDGIMEQVAGAPRSRPDWKTNNPRRAALAFARDNNQFILEEPRWRFNEGIADRRVTYWPDAFLRRVR
jgi:cephalosporin hydroxylase